MTTKPKTPSKPLGHRRPTSKVVKKSASTRPASVKSDKNGHQNTGPRPELAAKADFARLSGATRSQVSRWSLRGGCLHSAMVGDRVDLAHSAVAELLRRRGLDPAAVLPKVGIGAASAASSPSFAPGGRSGNTEVDQLVRLRAEVTGAFGSWREFYDWQKTRSAAAEAVALERRNEVIAGRLISTELVRQLVFGLFKELFLRLLTDAADTLSLRIPAEVRAGATREQILAIMRGVIGSNLEIAKRRSRTALRACRTNDNPPEVKTPAREGVPALQPGFPQDVKQRLRTLAAPKVVELVLQFVGRAASGDHWNAALFAEVMSTHSHIDAEARHVIGNILSAHVDAAVTDSLSADTTP